MRDDINHPSHYTRGKIEVIDMIESAVTGLPPQEAVLVANIIKYVCRYPDKNGVEDLQKASWYLNRLIKSLEEEQSQYRLVATANGIGVETPWGSLMVPREGDMFNSNDSARTHLMEAIAKKGGHCPCRIEETEDTLCPCTNYREEGRCICGLFVNIPQVVKGTNDKKKVLRDDGKPEEGQKQ